MSRRLKIVVDRDLCDTHGICVAKAPTLFSISDDDDEMRVLVEHPPPEALDSAENAVRSCPKGALSLVED